MYETITEINLKTLILTVLAMLLGEKGKDWAYYGEDGDSWWALRLYTRIN